MAFVSIKDDKHWHDIRKLHVGGTECSALFGLNPHLTKFELWHAKKGHLPEPDFSGNDRVFWGKHLEPAIASGIAAKKGWNLEKVEEYCVNDTCVGHGVTMDYKIVGHERGMGICEIKTVDFLEYKKWTDGPPIYYELQLQAQMECSKWDWGIIGVLIGGNDLKVFEYERRPVTGAKIAAAVHDFWESIRTDDPPPPNFEMDSGTIIQLYKEAGSGFTNLTGDANFNSLCDAYSKASSEQSSAESRKKAAKAELLTVIGSFDTASSEKYSVSAKMVESDKKEPYRNFRVTERKNK